MMKANELRFGNLIRHTHCEILTSILKGKIIEVNFSNDPEYVCNVRPELYEPIPLTEEWLLKFGFIDTGSYYLKGAFSIAKMPWTNGKIGLYAYAMDYSMELKYVHQLQNLYFALTGEELEAK